MLISIFFFSPVTGSKDEGYDSTPLLTYLMQILKHNVVFFPFDSSFAKTPVSLLISPSHTDQFIGMVFVESAITSVWNRFDDGTHLNFATFENGDSLHS